MEGISNIAQLISDYGAATVLIAVFLVIFIVAFKLITNNQSKSLQRIIDANQQYSQSIMEQNQELLHKLIEAQTAPKNHNVPEFEERDLVSIFVKINKVLKTECIATMNILGCDRIGIYVFHNGAASSHGLPFFKMSCVTESIKNSSGIASKMQEHAGLPLTMFDDFVDTLFDEGIYIVSLDDRNNITAKTKPSLGLNNRKAFSLSIPVYDTEYKIMGFSVAEFLKPINGNTQLEHIRSELYKLNEKTSPVLAFSEYQKINSNKG